MNCKNVEPLLPLYVGGDLDEKQSRLVAGHLQSCTECSVVADEYAGARQVLQGYEGPVFSDEIYTRLRRQVLTEIARESHPRVWPGIFSRLFLPLVQPRMRWAAAALLLAISVTALYFSRNVLRRLPTDHQVAVRTEEPKQAGAEVRSEQSNESAGSSSSPNKMQVRMAATRGPITRKREANDGVVATNLTRELAQAIKVEPSSNYRVIQRAVGVSQPSSDAGPVRVEIQTSDRNIRIIWLPGQRPGTDGTDGSKGL